MDLDTVGEQLLGRVSWVPPGLRLSLPVGWVAAPFEAGSAMLEDECVRFVEICRRPGSKQIVCGIFERDDRGELLEGDLDPASIDTLQRRLAGLYQILADDQVTLFIVWFSMYDCAIVLGQKQGCVEFLGTELDVAVVDFFRDVEVCGERLAQRLAEAPWDDLTSGGAERIVEFRL